MSRQFSYMKNELIFAKILKSRIPIWSQVHVRSRIFYHLNYVNWKAIRRGFSGEVLSHNFSRMISLDLKTYELKDKLFDPLPRFTPSTHRLHD